MKKLAIALGLIMSTSVFAADKNDLTFNDGVISGSIKIDNQIVPIQVKLKVESGDFDDAKGNDFYKVSGFKVSGWIGKSSCTIQELSYVGIGPDVIDTMQCNLGTERQPRNIQVAVSGKIVSTVNKKNTYKMDHSVQLELKIVEIKINEKNKEFQFNGAASEEIFSYTTTNGNYKPANLSQP